ncbi:NmrA family NAD(P)-binding protein [Weissella confusa]|uniref:NmrA family NAD(P)-binding protein n=1 Tax=Weissella confusa TaxID=1583 RepID=A0A923SNU1_WEICO|nr:NmrA family NAD(P)-binding protein [Weissella confusa]
MPGYFSQQRQAGEMLMNSPFDTTVISPVMFHGGAAGKAIITDSHEKTPAQTVSRETVALVYLEAFESESLVDAVRDADIIVSFVGSSPMPTYAQALLDAIDQSGTDVQRILWLGAGGMNQETTGREGELWKFAQENEVVTMTNVLVLGATGNVAQYFIDNFENVAPNDMQLTLLARRPRGLTRDQQNSYQVFPGDMYFFGARL